MLGDNEMERDWGEVSRDLWGSDAHPEVLVGQERLFVGEPNVRLLRVLFVHLRTTPSHQHREHTKCGTVYWMLPIKKISVRVMNYIIPLIYLNILVQICVTFIAVRSLYCCACQLHYNIVHFIILLACKRTKLYAIHPPDSATLQQFVCQWAARYNRPDLQVVALREQLLAVFPRLVQVLPHGGQLGKHALDVVAGVVAAGHERVAVGLQRAVVRKPPVDLSLNTHTHAPLNTGLGQRRQHGRGINLYVLYASLTDFHCFDFLTDLKKRKKKCNYIFCFPPAISMM